MNVRHKGKWARGDRYLRSRVFLTLHGTPKLLSPFLMRTEHVVWNEAEEQERTKGVMVRSMAYRS